MYVYTALTLRLSRYHTHTQTCSSLFPQSCRNPRSVLHGVSCQTLDSGLKFWEATQVELRKLLPHKSCGGRGGERSVKKGKTCCVIISKWRWMETPKCEQTTAGEVCNCMGLGQFLRSVPTVGSWVNYFSFLSTSISCPATAMTPESGLCFDYNCSCFIKHYKRKRVEKTKSETSFFGLWCVTLI